MSSRPLQYKVLTGRVCVAGDGLCCPVPGDGAARGQTLGTRRTFIRPPPPPTRPSASIFFPKRAQVGCCTTKRGFAFSGVLTPRRTPRARLCGASRRRPRSVWASLPCRHRRRAQDLKVRYQATLLDLCVRHLLQIVQILEIPAVDRAGSHPNGVAETGGRARTNRRRLLPSCRQRALRSGRKRAHRRRVWPSATAAKRPNTSAPALTSSPISAKL